MDPLVNFGYSTVSVAPAPALSGTTIQFVDPSVFPDPSTLGAFNLVVWPAGVALALASNAEIIRCTALAAGVFTISRVQEGSSMRAIAAGDQVSLAATAKTFTDLGLQVTQGRYSGGTPTSVPAGLIDHLLPWHDLSDGDAVLDLTDPTLPTVVGDGLYLVTVEIQPSPAAGKRMQAYLYADYNGDFWDGPAQTMPLDDFAGSGFNPCSMNFQRKLTSGTNLAVVVMHDNGSALPMNLWAHVVRIENANSFTDLAPKTQTVTVTTDPDTFAVDHFFDLGDLATFRLTGTLLSSVADGETFGSAPGNIAFNIENVQSSVDGVNTVASIGVWAANTPDGVYDRYGMTPRYLRVRVQIIDFDSFDTYAGANHPTVTVRLDVEYR